MKKIIKFFVKIYTFIRAVIEVYIMIPFRAWKNYVLRGAYIEDNERNRQIVDYLFKVTKDGSYEPSTPVEHYVEKQLRESYEEAIRNNEQLIRNEYNGEIPPYEEVRSDCAEQIVFNLISYRWIEESRWDDE